MNDKNFTDTDIAYYVDYLPIRAVEELAYQLGIESCQDEETLRRQTSEALNGGAIQELFFKYNLKSNTPIWAVVKYIKQDIVSQLNYTTWETIASYEQESDTIVHLPSTCNEQANMTFVSPPLISHEGLSDPTYLSFFRDLHGRGRQAFAEAFGVDVDNLSAYFTDEGLAFLQEKYGYSRETTFRQFSEAFQHALGVQMPAKEAESWEWIENSECYKNHFTHAKGLFPGCGQQKHTYIEARPNTSFFSYVPSAEEAIMSDMYVSRNLKTPPVELI